MGAEVLGGRLKMAQTDEKGSFSGLSDSEAKEFHKLFVTSFLVFTAIAIVAHVLAWMWRPWLPGVNGYGMLDIDTARVAVQSLLG
jgi:light-harvesting complex 1 beta chain